MGYAGGEVWRDPADNHVYQIGFRGIARCVTDTLRRTENGHKFPVERRHRCLARPGQGHDHGLTMSEVQLARLRAACRVLCAVARDRRLVNGIVRDTRRAFPGIRWSHRRVFRSMADALRRCVRTGEVAPGDPLGPHHNILLEQVRGNRAVPAPPGRPALMLRQPRNNQGHRRAGQQPVPEIPAPLQIPENEPQIQGLPAQQWQPRVQLIRLRADQLPMPGRVAQLPIPEPEQQQQGRARPRGRRIIRRRNPARAVAVRRRRPSTSESDSNSSGSWESNVQSPPQSEISENSDADLAWPIRGGSTDSGYVS